MIKHLLYSQKCKHVGPSSLRMEPKRAWQGNITCETVAITLQLYLINILLLTIIYQRILAKKHHYLDIFRWKT